MIGIKAWNLEEAWRLTCKEVMVNGKDYQVERGSYVGQQRRQLLHLMLMVRRPGDRPLAPLVPPGENAVTNEEAIQRYFTDYLMCSTLAENEQYTYGNRIDQYLEHVARMLTKTPHTNQAVIEISRPEDILLNDPPCLRVLDWKVIDDTLWLSSYWRSWDVHGALPVNLGGLQLLNEMMAEWVGLWPGPQVAYSSGAHIYEHAWEWVR